MSMGLARALSWFWRRHLHPGTGKADIANALGRANGYTTYLEVATRTTGHTFGRVSPGIFSTRCRILYNVPAGHTDSLPVQYSSAELTSESCFRELGESGRTFDVVFVDPHHTYEASRIDIEWGVRLLNPSGVLVVHDCNPPDKDLTSPDFKPGSWLGQTYLAFLDFVGRRPELDYCVVDTDWGVGLVYRRGGDKPACDGPLPPRIELGALNLRDWEVFDRSRSAALRLISVKHFNKLFTAATLPRGADPGLKAPNSNH